MRRFLPFLFLISNPAFANGLMTMGVNEASTRARLDQSWGEICEFPEGITGFRFQARVTAGGYMTNPKIMLSPDGSSNLPLEFCIDQQINPMQPLKASGEAGEIYYSFELPIEEPEMEPTQISGPMVTTITVDSDGEITIVQTATNEGDESPP